MSGRTSTRTTARAGVAKRTTNRNAPAAGAAVRRKRKKNNPGADAPATMRTMRATGRAARAAGRVAAPVRTRGS
jgi:hypothetical protein